MTASHMHMCNDCTWFIPRFTMQGIFDKTIPFCDKNQSSHFLLCPVEEFDRTEVVQSNLDKYFGSLLKSKKK